MNYKRAFQTPRHKLTVDGIGMPLKSINQSERNPRILMS